MNARAELLIRTAQQADLTALQNLVQFESYVHRHLDWRNPMQWLTASDFWVAESQGKVIAALACVPDPPEPAWIRLFANRSSRAPSDTWAQLWDAALQSLAFDQYSKAAAIALYPWFQTLLEKSGFRNTHDVVTLSWRAVRSPDEPPSAAQIRPMRVDDLTAVLALDSTAFDPIWRISSGSLLAAFSDAQLATVFCQQGEVVGYQITTHNPWGGHLARLAVSPHARRQGIGRALVQNMLRDLFEHGALQVTVNTQSNNQNSLRLYERLGFQKTGEYYPVYEYDLAAFER